MDEVGVLLLFGAITCCVGFVGGLILARNKWAAIFDLDGIGAADEYKVGGSD